MRHEVVAGLLAAAGAALTMGVGPDARACGGCFPPLQETQSGTVVTDERMIFAISQQQTTLYDQIEYQGAPSSFAWVLPIKGPVTVGLSADSLFALFDSSTQTTIVAPFETQCPSCTCGQASSASSSGGDVGTSSGGVSIISQQVVGPYATVQLKSSDPDALTKWLTANGYAIASNVAPVIAAYVAAGFDFLALRLVPGQGVQAMRPVSVTMPGPVLSLPLRMAAAGTGAIVGLTLWIVAEGRYEPQNFPFFVIDPSELTWDFSTKESNYSTIRAQKEAATNNTAWQIESSTDMSPSAIESQLIGDVNSDYAAIPAADAGASDGGPIAGETADEVREQDLATLFPGGPQTVRVTRMRADLSQAALANDMVFQASSDQSTLSNYYSVTKSVNDVVCAPFDAAACGCGNLGVGSGGSGSGGGAGDGSGSASDDGGAALRDGPASRSPSSSGCAMGRPNATGLDVGSALVGLLGLAFVRALNKKR